MANSSAKESLRELLALYREAFLLETASSILSWDQTTMMPIDAAPLRAETLGRLAVNSQESLRSERFAALFKTLGRPSALRELSESEKVQLGHLRRLHRLASVLPPTLVRDISEASALGRQAWQAAKAVDDYSLLRPQLAKIIELKRKAAEIKARDFLVINNRDALYDAMLDDFEPGMSNGELRPLLTELKGFLAELIRKIGISGVAVGAGVQHALQQQKGKSVFAVERQQEFCRQLVSKLGFDWARGRLDQAAHPFCSGIKFDTRLTSHYSEADPLIGIYAILHEVGHGLYVQGVADDLVGTPAGELSSMSLHESQSLLWETSVGHGFEFCEYLLHRLLEHYGQPFADLETGDLFGFVNRVNPGLIRVEADDVSYNLHIIIRWELEQELIDGELEVAKLPEAWRQRYEALLGVVPKDDRRGVLQDPHWSQGQFGYFPTYTLGSLLAAQLYASAGQALRDLKVSIKAGAFSLLAQWLRKNVHHHGLLLAPEALIRQVCGGPRSSEPFKQLVKNRLEQAYDLKL